jgi:hypothetical protein
MLLILLILGVQGNFDEQFSRIQTRITNIRMILEENHILTIYKDLNSLQELLNHINSEISALESAASHQTEGHGPLETKEAEIALKITDKIIEKLALLDTKLVNVDDREVLDKIEEYVLKMDEIDNFLRKVAKNTKENLEKFDKHVKESHGHFWIWTMCIVSAVLLLGSWRMLIK